MSSLLTQYGIENLKVLLEAFNELGQDILSGKITEEVNPVNKKSLRTFRMKEACQLVGRSDAFIRKLENQSKDFFPHKVNGTRFYTLELINKIRDKAGTRLKRPLGSNPIIISVSNFKGGVGKSIVSKSLADKLAISGLRILSIGLDAQGTDSLYYGFIPDLEITPEETIRSALLDDSTNIKKLIKKTYFPGIDIIPGNLSLTEVEIKLTDYKEQINQVKKLGFPDERLSNALAHIKDDYDVILIDCGPNLNILTLNAVNACNALLIPVPPALPDLASFCTFCHTLTEHLQNSDKIKSLDFFRVLISKSHSNKSSHRISKIIREHFGSYVLLRDIVFSSEIESAASKFTSLYELPHSSKKSYQLGVESMESVFNEIFDAIKMIWESQISESKDEK